MVITPYPITTIIVNIRSVFLDPILSRRAPPIKGIIVFGAP
jgi:hypothetical protein